VSSPIGWHMTPSVITVTINHRPHNIPKESVYYASIKEAIKSEDWDAIPRLVDLAGQVRSYTRGLCELRGDQLYIENQEVHGALADRVMAFMREGLPFDHLAKFWQRLQENPSFRAVNGLFACLEANHHPILPDGRFLAYKKVRDNWTDSRTGTFDNSVGSVVTMPRNQVDEDPDRTCSHGLHVASWAYAQGFSGTRLLEVAVNPADVVAVPKDYSRQKMRVCCYQVMAEAQGEEIQEQVIEPARRWKHYQEIKEPGPQEQEGPGYCIECGEELNTAGDCPDCDDPHQCSECGW